MGIKRVVLSRETSLQDIKLIKQNTNLEIEYFVQGALCVCFSGNCYLSSCLFGKSGNRGECMQPCRLPYRAVLKGKQIANGYLLSAKDFNMSKRLKDLSLAGVDSFKIEGRLRRPAYVYETTKVYRQIIDNNYESTDKMQLSLKKAFNRGDYTEGYFNGNGNIIDEQIQGHRGVKIGTVTQFVKGAKFNIVKIKANKICKNDVLKFIKNGKEHAVITAVDVKQNGNLFEITTTAQIPVGCDANLILDYQAEQNALNTCKKLPISFNLIAKQNMPLKLLYTLQYGINSQIKTYSGVCQGNVCEKAKTIALSFLQAQESLQKLNDTNFYLKDFSLETDGVFVSKSNLNEIRRQALEQIEAFFSKKNEVIFNENYIKEIKNLYVKNTYKNKPKATLEIAEKFDSNADYLVIKPTNFTSFEYKKITHKNAFLYVPSFLPNQDLIIIKNILKNNKNLGVYAQNIGALSLSNKIILGAKLNIKNVFAVKQLLSFDVCLVETSPELLKDDFDIINQVFSVPMVESSLKNFELMTLISCPIKTIFKNSCATCKYQNGIEYIMQNGTVLSLQRYKIKSCFFTLIKK